MNRLPMDCFVIDISPSVSEWGLVVMTLVGLAAGTIVFSRRRLRGEASTG